MHKWKGLGETDLCLAVEVWSVAVCYGTEFCDGTASELSHGPVLVGPTLLLNLKLLRFGQLLCIAILNIGPG